MLPCSSDAPQFLAPNPPLVDKTAQVGVISRKIGLVQLSKLAILAARRVLGLFLGKTKIEHIPFFSLTNSGKGSIEIS